MKYEIKTNANATEGRTFKATINGVVKEVKDIRYSVSTPVFESLEEFCTEASGMSEAAQAGLLSLITTAIANSYMNKAVEHIARDLPVEVWTIGEFFSLTGNREGIAKAIETNEEKLVELAEEKMQLLAKANGILAEVFSAKITMVQAQELQGELMEGIARVDKQVEEVKVRLAGLEVIRKEQEEKNKARGLKAAEARKANAEEKKK